MTGGAGPDPARPEASWPDASRPVAVVDLDGVVADVRHRLPYLTRPPKKWDAFFAAAPDDAVLDEGRAVAERLAEDHEVVYLSGRPERCRDDTEAWLRRHELPPGRVLLRPEGDRRPAWMVKVERLQDLAAERRVTILVDDDPAVWGAAREHGFAVFEATWMAEHPALFEAQERDGRT